MSFITYDRGEAHLRGQIPLDKIKALVEGLSPDTVTGIDFSCNGYCTDAVLYTIATSAKVPFTNITDVNLQGCTLLTDVGIKWLTQFIKDSQVSMVLLDGCSKLTENSLALLVEVVSETCTITMRSTSMRYIESIPVKTLKVQASPIITDSVTESKPTTKQGHVLVVPHSSVKQTVSTFIKSKTSTNRELAHYETDCKGKDWNVSLTEMSLDNPLFDVMVRENPVQVVIPFDATADVREIKSHIMDTVSRVICKERVFGKLPLPAAATGLSQANEHLPFMDINNLVNQIMTKDFVLTNFPKGEVIGCYYSRQMLSRSNPYFEVQCEQSKSQVGDEKVGILIGCLYDVLYGIRDPMNTEVDVGGEVESFETEVGDIYGFGMEGTWESEYCPSADIKFYATKNGERHKGDLLNKNTSKTNHYPLVACMGEGGSTRMKFLNMAFPPKDLMKTWEKEKRTVEKGYTEDLLVDNDGIISYLGTGANGCGFFFSLHNIIENERDTCTFRIEDLGENKDEIAFGIGPYDLDFKAMKNTNLLIFKNETGKIISDGNVSDKLFTLDKGDEITLKMKFIKDAPGSSKVEVHKNSKQVAELDYRYKESGGLARVHFIAKIGSNNAKVKIKNFRPTYRQPALIPEKVTVGRIHLVKVMDDGKIVSEPPLTRQTMHGIFVAKTPLNANMTHFKMKVVELNGNTEENEIWVGLSHSFVPMHTHLGTTCGTVACSSSGKLFLNGKQIENVKADDVKFQQNDLIGCGVEVSKSLPSNSKSLHYNKDRTIKSQQKVLVYFTKNGKRVCETELEHVWDGLFPCVTMSKPGMCIHVSNFYPESSQIRKQLKAKELAKQKAAKGMKMTDKKEEQPVVSFSGCEFLVLGLGKNGSDVGGKMQLIEQQINLKDDLPSLTNITNHIGELEKNLSDLDLQKQENYSQLCNIKDNMKRLGQESNRLHFVGADLTSGKGHDKILQQIEDTFESYRLLQEPRFNLSKNTLEVMGTISAKLKEKKMMKVIASDFGIENICNDVFTEVVRHMHEMGNLFLVELGSTHVAIDIPYVLKVLMEIEKLSVKSMVNAENTVLAISKTSHIWTEEKFNMTFQSLSTEWDLFKKIMKGYMGLLKIPCFRTKPDDPKFIFTTLSSLSTPPMSLREFWSQGEATQNFVLVQCTYSFPHTLPDNILALILSHMTKYGRILLLTSEGAAFQLGAVQTVVLRHEGHMEKGVISVESKCYFPKKMADPVFELTETNVREYTWNVFCLYTDIVDSVLKQQNLVPMISRKVPSGLVNMSVGCKHTWKAFDSSHIQSVCTLCRQCCGSGMDCPWNGIVGSYMRECGCKTEFSGCVDCGICQSCAKEMWEIRSRIRPFPSMTNQILQDIPFIPMDPVTFDEIEFIHLQGKPPNLCLREVNDGTLINVFPGQVISLVGEDDKKLEQKLTKVAMNNRSDRYGYSSTVKDHIIIRLSDPLNVMGKVNADSRITGGITESRVVYHASISRELRVSQETGLVCYDSTSSAIPVAQLVGPKPFSKHFSSFSIKLMSRGQRGTLVIGVCPKTYPPNRQPGWNRFSIAYHGDDGGIFIESGFPKQSTKKKWEVGDIIRCELITDLRKLTFFKNDEQIYSTTVNFPRGGYYPAVGMHSNGECLRLLEKEPWLPVEEEANIKPLAFDTHKYGNLFISPARTLGMKKFSSQLRGWMILHNPSKDKIGYKVSEVYDLNTNPKDHINILAPGENVAINVLPGKSMTAPTEVTVKWIALEKSKNYSVDYVTDQFRTAPEDSIYNHRMSVNIQDSSLGDVEELPKFTSLESAPSHNVILLEILKNKSLVDKYWMKVGAYKLDLPNAKGDYFINHPKCPTFLYPSVMQKGLKVVIKVNSDLAEAVVSEMYEHGGYSLDYTPAGKQENETLCFEPGIVGINETDWEDDKNILLFKSDNEMRLLNQTYLPAPPYLTTEGSKKALASLDPDWKSNALISFSLCSQTITRVTVQEQMITHQSRTLKDWLEGFGYNGHVDTAYAFLPRTLDTKTLTFPVANTMFDDVTVHRLCSFADQLLHFQPTHNLDLRVPIHFVDIPGEVPTQPIPVNLTYGCLYSGWVYIALLAHKIMLPSYSKIFTDSLGSYSRDQVEALLYYLIQPYASLCSVYAAQVGGLPNQANPINGAEKMEKLLESHKESYIKFKGSPVSDTHKLVKHGRMLSCKAHQLSISGNPSIYSKDLQMNYDYFEPYNEVVNAFSWDLPLLPSLPTDFFSKFSNLQCFFLHRCALKNTREIPSGISNCKDLETVILAGLGVSKLPKDLLQGPALKSVTCRGLPVKSLDLNWPAESQLTKLVLSSLLLTQVPSEISMLTELIELNLDYNPIVSLPDSLKSIQKLKVLSIKGIPWVTFEGTRSSMTRDQYTRWHEENKCVAQNMPGEDMQKFFNKFDTNKNSELDESEISHLNLHMFFKIPRIRNKKSDEYGGIPAVIFELSSLQELYLNFQAITLVPAKMSQLQNLQVLSLNNCPLLESISGSVGLIPNIKVIRLTSCPSLRTPPNEVVGRGFEAIRAYLKRLAGGFTECRRTKLMFVGLGGAGKTSLLQALMSVNKKTSGTQNSQLTDGIEIKPWTVKADSGLDITFSTWDFAGQTVYYNTHQFFLSNRAVYMLLWNMRMGFEHAGLDFWLSSVACHAPETPILVVGTQSDQEEKKKGKAGKSSVFHTTDTDGSMVGAKIPLGSLVLKVPKVDIPEKDLKQRYPQISSFHYVSSIKGDGIAALEKQLIEVTLQQKYMGEKIPQVWLNLEKKILAERTNSSILKWDTVKDFAMDQGIYDDKDVKLAVKFLDDLGTVQYFDNDFLRDRIVINPQWIVNVMACVVSVKKSPIQENEGRFKHEHMQHIWKDYSEDLHNWLLRLTEEFDLTFPLPKDEINIVPCLLPQEEPKDLESEWPDFNTEKSVRENKMVYKFTYLPAGLFNRAQVRLFQFSNGKLIWKKGSLLTKNKHLALIRQANDYELVVLVQGPRPENVLLMIHEVFESLIEESFHGVTYDFFIPCPDCISKEGTREPCLFKGDLIRRAGDLKAPFLQCTKYFHTVSMGQLLEMMPEDKDTDFDIHLQHSISALQSINKDMCTDVAILYAKADVPQSGAKNEIDPHHIHKDLEGTGLSCWFPNMKDGAKVEDIMVAMKNCKVLVALMSDEFEKDKLCNSVLIYAMENLKKPFHIAVIRESMDWQKSDLGMKIGQPRMAMIKQQSRYETKIKDLIEMTTETVNGINQTMDEHPVCFISYCWVNSRQAVQLGTKARPGSLGWGDPRDCKDHLTKKGIKCWIDHEQMGKYGLYHDIAVGLQNCKLMVAFVSDEYVKSDACMMELRFGVCTMHLPLVVVIVGTGSEWKQTEVGLLMRRSANGVSKVYMQKENPDGLDVLYQYVQDCLPKPGEATLDSKKYGEKKQKDKVKKSSQEDSRLSYKEEYELIQRKFMRHISTMISKTDLEPLPKLLVFDFLKGKWKNDNKDRPTNADSSSELKMLRPKTASKSHIKMKPIPDIDEDDWEEEELCIRVLCEHEEGWHLLDNPLNLRTNTKEEIHNAVMLAAPFLTRIYAILRQSSMKLNCVNSKKGNNFQNWLEDKRDSQEKDGSVASTFLTAYIEFIKFVQDQDEVEKFISQLDRCHLPSGKVSWLCAEHQKGNRITKLGSDEVSAGGGGKNTLFKEDMFFKEYLEEHPEYKEMMHKVQREKTMMLQRENSHIRPPSSKADKKKEKEKKTEKGSNDKGKEEIKTQSKDDKKENGDIKKETISANKMKLRAVKDVIDVTNAASKLTRENTKLGKQNSQKTPNASPPDSETSSQVSTSSKGSKMKAVGNAAKLTTKGSSSRKGSQACVLQ